MEIGYQFWCGIMDFANGVCVPAVSSLKCLFCYSDAKSDAPLHIKL